MENQQKNTENFNQKLFDCIRDITNHNCIDSDMDEIKRKVREQDNDDQSEEEWCKIFRAGNQRVLVTKEGYNEEDENYGVKISTMTDDVFFKVTIGVETQDQMHALFNKFTMSDAIQFLGKVNDQNS